MSELSDKLRKEWTVNDAKRDEGLFTPCDIERADDIKYGPCEKMNALDVYRPKGSGDILPVIISVHGGGWVYGDKELYQHYCMSLAQRGFAVVNFTYRLAPEAKFPAQLEDLNSVVKWVCENSKAFKMDINRVFMTGDSAGAHLLGLYMALCTSKEYASHFEFKAPEGFLPKAIALNCGAFEPVTEKALEAAENNKELIGDLIENDEKEKWRPVINVTENVNEKFPPVYLMTCHGDFCMDQAPLLEEMLKKNKVPYVCRIYGEKERPLYHVFHLNMKDENGKRCNDEECDFFKKYI